MLIISKNLLLLTATFLIGFVNCSKEKIYNPDIVLDDCKTAKAVESDYIPTGDEWKLGDLTIYETRNKTANRIVIVAYDIFGYHNNTKQVADIIAEEFGFRLLMPDFFRNVYWDINNFPPKDPQELVTFINTRGDWEDYVKMDVVNVIEHFKSTENVTEFGIYGMCWGGKISTRAAVEVPEIKAAVLVHPSSVTTDEADEVVAPMYLLPSRGEANMLPFYMVLQQKFGNNCGHRRFDDMNHGFAGARGNFSDPLNVLRVGEVIDIIGNFFNKNLH